MNKVSLTQCTGAADYLRFLSSSRDFERRQSRQINCGAAANHWGPMTTSSADHRYPVLACSQLLLRRD
jgi:hypothetical protein